MASAFEHYLRTGRRSTKIQTKFNPWHDPENGRFTFAGQGRYFPGGSAGQHADGHQNSRARAAGDGARQSASHDSPRRHTGRNDPKNPRNHSLYTVKRGDTLTKIAGLRRGLSVADLEWLNELSADRQLQIGQKIRIPHQHFLDAGKRARDTFLALAHYVEITGGKLPPNVARPPSIAVQIEASGRREFEANGYRYEIDMLLRTRHVSGEFGLRRSYVRGAHKRMQASRTAAALIMAAISLPLDSMARVSGSTTLLKTPTSIAALTAPLRISGQQPSALGVACSSTSSLIIRKLRCGPTSLHLPGSSTEIGRSPSSTMKRRADNMTGDRFDKLGPMLAEIGGVAAEIVGGDADGVYLYVEVGDRWISPSLFKDEVSVVRYYTPSSELTDLIYELWHAAPPDKRWAVMEYEIKGAKFDADFKFPDEVDVESFEVDRRDLTLRNRFGDKPVDYGPSPFDNDEQ